jgi:hypothetical protein
MSLYERLRDGLSGALPVIVATPVGYHWALATRTAPLEPVPTRPRII